VPAELVAIAGRLNNALRRLESGWAIFVEAHAMSAGSYPPNTFRTQRPPWSMLSGGHSSKKPGTIMMSSFSDASLSAADEGTAKAERLLYEVVTAPSTLMRVSSPRFVDRTKRVLQLVEGFMPECAWLDDEETLTYLHSTVSTKRHRVRGPRSDVSRRVLADRR